ncbi:hypothetical protein C8Q80DRAFT_1271282 [Daedaleopsis nitida]|nr:hypothetical protein C8Q80DRAFT_1271282 [Daedaleopsis nitida]
MVSTRSQHTKAVHAKAATTPLQDTRTFSSLKNLILFVEIAHLKPEYGTVLTHLRITMTVSSLERDIFERIFAACLALTPNLVILELNTTPPIPLPSLAGIHLPTIEVLKTNVPHRALGPFLVANPSLRALDISSCGRGACSLGSFVFEHITEIRCPVRCASDVVHDAVSRLRLDSCGTGILGSNFITKITDIPETLYTLTVEFCPDDAWILRAISATFPQLRNLKLVEKSKTSVHKHKPRPWSNCRRWSTFLKKMPYLEHLVIRTEGTLSSAQPSAVADNRVFRGWLGSEPHHPMLRRVTVWQRVHDRGGVLSEWCREGELWDAKWTPNPDAYQVMMFD